MADKITINAPFSQETRSLGRIGRVGENISRQIVFDCSSVLADRPNAGIVCVIQRPGDKQPYTGQLVRDGSTSNYELVLTSTEVAAAGSVRLELRMVDCEEILKAAIYTGTVADSLPGIGDTPRDPIADALNRLENAIAAAGKYANLDARLDAIEATGLSALGAAEGQVPTADGSGAWAWESQIELDAELTSEGKAADAKATGDAIRVLTARQNVLVGTASGTPVSVSDAFAAPFAGLRVCGKCTQDGTPSQTAPVSVVNAGDGGTVTVTVSDGADKSQTLILQTPNALPGISVASGGNYTDENGQQWVCEEVDLARGVRVQRIAKIKPSSSMNWQTANSKRVDRYFNTFNDINAAGMLCTHFSCSVDGETIGGIIANSKNLGFAYAEKGTTTVSDFKAFLDANDVYVWAVLVAPVETALSSAEIAAYKALTTYAPTTSVTVSGGAGAEVKYQRDVNLVVKALEDAIASMTTT